MLPLSEELRAILMAVGTIILLFSSALESFWEFGRQVRPDLRPGVFETQWRSLILLGWVLLLLIGGAMLMAASPVVGLAAIVVFWLLLPIMVGPRVRKRALPPWDDLKKELEAQGYNQRNYWRRGDWWKAERKTRPRSDSESEPRS